MILLLNILNTALYKVLFVLLVCMLIAYCFSSRSGESVYPYHVCITILSLINILFSLGKWQTERTN